MLIRLVFFLALIVSGAVRAADPLPPEQVFRFNARVIDAATIEATWQVRRDYYLYRDKFKFSSPDASLATPVLPKGEMKDDEAFGRVEVYRDELAVRVPGQCSDQCGWRDPSASAISGLLGWRYLLPAAKAQHHAEYDRRAAGWRCQCCQRCA
jgi:hypothetical protein